jgi:hypothetical protein
MTLIEEVRDAFEKSREENAPEDESVMVAVSSEDEMVPGFMAMRQYYEDRLLAMARRGYRHFAGGTLPTDSDELIRHTAPVMMPPWCAVMMAAFTHGLMIGHQDDYLVRMCVHFDNVEHLFHDKDFLESSRQMALGFEQDEEVKQFFVEYVTGGMNYMAHVTGFAHQKECQVGKVWDVWLLIGTAASAASYLAGYHLGSIWKERDVLDGIEIASEEGARGTAGAPDGDH